MAFQSIAALNTSYRNAQDERSIPQIDSQEVLLTMQDDLQVVFLPHTGPRAGLFGCAGGCLAGAARQTSTGTPLNAS